MGITSFNYGAFLDRINCLSSWDALFLAHDELTAVERLLIKEKALKAEEREDISFYAKRLRNYIVSSRTRLNGSHH
jgi:hypothetical protein